MKNWHIFILIPAKNEEELLPRCLNSILRARAALPYFISSQIILTVDASQDKSYALGKRILGHRGIVLESDKSNVGHARKIAALYALKHYQGPLNRCWLAHTDADCEVPENWLSHQLERAEMGFQALAGIVKVDSFKEHEDSVFADFSKSYLIHADGSHPHVHGANFGVRADAYLLAGGWNELTTAEDHDLWNRMTALNIPKISDSQSYVITSGRRQGRAPHGFAGTLASLNKHCRGNNEAGKNFNAID